MNEQRPTWFYWRTFPGRWRDWPDNVFEEDGDIWLGHTRTIPVYEVRLTRGRADDMARIRANGINTCRRTVVGYASGRIGEEGFIFTEGGSAAWLIPWAHPEKKDQWKDGRQVARRIVNPLAGYRQPAVIEVA